MKKKGGQKFSVDEFIVKDFKEEKYRFHEGYCYEVFDEKTSFKTVTIVGGVIFL